MVDVRCHGRLGVVGYLVNVIGPLFVGIGYLEFVIDL